jgi:hypothetical protein
LNNPKNEVNISTSSVPTSSTTKNNDPKQLSINTGSIIMTENTKTDQNERVSSANSQENSFSGPQTSTGITQSTSSLNTNSQPAQTNTLTTSQTLISGSASTKASKKKDVNLNSPKTSLSKDSVKTSKITMTPTKSSNRALKEKGEGTKKSSDMIQDSPSKGIYGAANTSTENFSDNESPTHSRSHSARQQDVDISRYYKKEKGKLNIWTYLFMNLNKSINEIYTMCDMENITEFNNGVISTLECAIDDLKKLNKKIELEHT